MNKKNIKLIVLLGVSVAGGLYLNKDKSEATVGRNLNKLLSGNTRSLVTRFNGYIGSGNMASPSSSMGGNIKHPINNPGLVRSTRNQATSNSNPTKTNGNVLSNVAVGEVSQVITTADKSPKVSRRTGLGIISGKGNGKVDINAVKGDSKSKDKKIHKRNDLKESTVVKGNSSSNRSGRGILEYLGIKSSNRNKQNTVDISNNTNVNKTGNKNIDPDPKLRVSLYITERGSGNKKVKGKEELSFNKMQFRVNKDDLDGFSNDIEHNKTMNKEANGVSGELKLRNETGNTKGMLEGLLGSLNISVEDEKTGKVDKMKFKVSNNKLDKVLLGRKDIVVIKHKQGNLKGELKIRRDKNQKEDIKLNVYWQE